MVARHTYLVTSRLVRRHALLEAARVSAHGRQILSPAQAAGRLAGGFLQAIERETLKCPSSEFLEQTSA